MHGESWKREELIESDRQRKTDKEQKSEYHITRLLEFGGFEI